MDNHEMRESWAVGADGWVRNERIFDASFAPFTEAVIAAADLGSAARVLDVGCGSGTLLAAATDAGAVVVGVDIAPGMVEAARRRVPTATVLEADAQTADLLAVAPGPAFDRVVSRFGVMFFDDPIAAFANLRGAAAPGARLVFVCWREPSLQMFTLGLGPLLALLTGPPAIPRPGVPGAMAFADRDRLLPILRDTGWADVVIAPLDGWCDYGIDGSDGLEERLAAALSGSVGRAARAELEPRLGPDAWSALLDDARAELALHVVDGSVRFVGHTWLVNAVNPG